MKIKIAFCLALLLSAMNVCAGYVENASIEKLLAYDNYVVVKFTESSPNTESCSRADAGYYVGISINDGEILYPTLMAGYMAGKKISFGTSGCHVWGGGVPKVYRVEIHTN